MMPFPRANASLETLEHRLIRTNAHLFHAGKALVGHSLYLQQRIELDTWPVDTAEVLKSSSHRDKARVDTL